MRREVQLQLGAIGIHVLGRTWSYKFVSDNEGFMEKNCTKRVLTVEHGEHHGTSLSSLFPIKYEEVQNVQQWLMTIKTKQYKLIIVGRQQWIWYNNKWFY